MQETGNNPNITTEISIQVSLSGYSFKVYEDGVNTLSSSWCNAGSIFTTPQLQKHYDRVNISVFTPKFTLVPEQFFRPEEARGLLEDVCILDEHDIVSYEPMPDFGAYLVYSLTIGENISKALSVTVLRTDGDSSTPLPEVYYMLESFWNIPDYNKIMVSYKDGHLYLIIGQGKSLLLCNAYEAVDFTTALYFIFLAMKKLQLNPEVSSICFRTMLDSDEEAVLYRYFKSVEYI